MCVIIWSPTGQIPHEQVVNAVCAHPDGWGFAVQSRKGLKTFRSIDIKKFFSAWHRRPVGPVLLHARWATHGKVATENCHPFHVRGHRMVVAHNGMLNGYGSKQKSDTLDFIEREIEKMPHGFTEDFRLMDYLSSLMGNSKMVLLSPTGDPVFLNERAGIWYNRLWYSNASAFSREDSEDC